MKRVIYTGTPSPISAAGYRFERGVAVDVPDAVAESLLKKPFYTLDQDKDPAPNKRRK